MNHLPELFLLPVGISDAPITDYLPASTIEIIGKINHFIVEDFRKARRFIKKCNPAADISGMTFSELNEHTPERDVGAFLNPLRAGFPMGIMSDAGCPGVADPGALAVRIAQQEGFRVKPLVGPSSILMALMASGLNGQKFAFNGYLPVEVAEREKKIRELESLSRKEDMTQIFIETPYRNQKMFESLLKVLHPETFICVAIGITDPEKERIITKTVAEWKKHPLSLEKLPAVFMLCCLNPDSRKR